FVGMDQLMPFVRDLAPGGERVFRSGGSRFRDGDVLLARITPCLENGKTARVSGLRGGTGHGSTEFIVLAGREGVTDSEWLYYLARWDRFREYSIQHMTGT